MVLLAEQDRPERFGAADVLRMVGNLPTDKSIEETLADLGQNLLTADRDSINRAIRRLERYLAGDREPADLTGYQQRIRAGRLLADDDRLSPALKGRLYDVLLPLAFGIPLTYDGYCAVERCAGVPLRTSLRTALARADAADCLTWILAREYRAGTRSEKLLDQLAQQRVPIPPAEPLELVVHAVAGKKLWQAHGPIVLDFALRYLWKFGDHPGAVLARYGYLASVYDHVYPGDEKTQAEQLTQVLGIAFRAPLSRPDIDAVLGQPGHPPTVALYKAVLRMTDPRDHAYVEEQLDATVRRSQGLPGRPRLTRRRRRWWAPWRRRRSSRKSAAGSAAGQSQFAGLPGPTGQPLPAAQQETVTVPVAVQHYQTARLASRVPSEDSVWKYPKTTFGVAAAFLAIFAVVYIVVQYGVLHG